MDVQNSGARGSSVDAARYLTAWRRRYGLSDAAAAEWCCLSFSAFRRQRRGGVQDSRCQQTIRLAELYAIHNTGWLDIAEYGHEGRPAARALRAQ